MEEGLFQLLFILLIFVAAIFDSIARSRKKRERMEEMEREEEEGLAEGQGTATDQRRTREPEAPEWEAPEWEPTRWEAEPKAGSTAGRDEEAAEPAPSAREGPDRETADRMVPEDLWAILTGQEPPSTTERPRPREEERPRPAADRPAPREVEPREGAPRREPTRPERGPAPRPRRDQPTAQPDERMGRRSDPDPPKQPHLPEPVPGDRYPSRLPDREALESAGRRAAETVREAGEAVAARMEEPWGDIPDIAKGEIGEERPARDPARRFPGPGARRRRPASGYTRLLQAGDRESLREAVVLREVLDVPLARRGSFGGWEGER